MSNLWADPDRLRAVSPQFAQLGEDVASALATLRAGLDSEGRCWGGDKPGQQFEKNYPQTDGPGNVKDFLAALTGLSEKVKATGDKITGTADALQTQDRDNADRIRRV